MGSSLKVTNPPAHILIASRGFQRKMTDQIKRMKLETKVLGFKFKVSRFTAFLAWTGMIACVMGMLVSLALLTIPTDVEPFMQALRYQLFINDALPEDFDDQYKDVFFTIWYWRSFDGHVSTSVADVLPAQKEEHEEGYRGCHEDIEGHLLHQECDRHFDIPHGHQWFG